MYNKNWKFRLLLCISIWVMSCGRAQVHTEQSEKHTLMPGVAAERTDLYLPLLQNKRVGVIANQTSVIGKTHLVDSLLALGVNIVKVFGPEHGFRGNHADGAHIKSEVDSKTSLPVISLYGQNKKPTSEQLKDIDILLFDIQDVGCRFYTYISTMSYAMEAAAEKGIPFLVLDRPNPNGFYVDGPVLEKGFESFVGLHPVPIVHGMTVGEYAQMVNGEGWLKNGIKCSLIVIPCQAYTHKSLYRLPIAPSPNLPGMESIYLYPTLCLFEGTDVSIGRGTDRPFELMGAPWWKAGNYSFTPKSIPGVSDNPKFKNTTCYGYNLHDFAEVVRGLRTLYIFWVIDAYQNAPDKSTFFTSYFNKLAGTAKLKEQIIAGKSEEEIKASWKPGLDQFKKIRKKYLLYPDFE